MAFKPKVDLSGVKNFFLEKGEKLGLFVCLAGTAALIGFGVVGGMAAAKTNWSKDIGVANQQARAKMEEGANVANVLPSITPDKANWPLWNSPYVSSPLWLYTDNNETRRTNPTTLPILASPERKEISMQYVRGSYFAHNLSHPKQLIEVVKQVDPSGAAQPVGPKGKNMANQAALQPTVITKPTRMVVVHAIFPLRAQLLNFQSAFRKPSLGDVFASGDLPKFLGMNIMKTEVVDGKEVKWVPLHAYDAKTEKNEVLPTIREMIREAILDEESVQENQPYLIQGLAMPFPKLAILPTGAYPAFELTGLDFDWNAAPAAGGGVPGGGGMMKPNMGKGMGAMGAMGAGTDVQFEWKPWNNLKQQSLDLFEKVTDRTYLLDPTAVNFDEEQPAATPGGPGGLNPGPVAGQANGFQGGSAFSAAAFWGRYPKPPMPTAVGGQPGPGSNVPAVPPRGGAGTAAAQKAWDNIVVRFFDPEVKPGKTYKYSVQIRLANPNFGKKDEVAYAGLADIKELPPSVPVATPTITIPEEYQLYAVDQKPELKVVGGSDQDPIKSDQAAVQIHRWVDETREGDQPLTVGDWAIAERLLVRRGRPISRIVNIEIPVWKKDKNAFEIGAALDGPGKAGMAKQPGKQPNGNPFGPGANAEKTATAGIPINFGITNPPDMLVDFDGRRELKLPNSAKIVAADDNGPGNLLILRADGTLIVRNTLVDSNINSDLGKERQRRVKEWSDKTAPFREGAVAAPGPGMRKAPGPGGS